MCWLKRGIWKTGIVITGILLLLVLMMWFLVSAVSAQEIAPGTVQATPTEDATVTALDKDKLAQEILQRKYQNEQLKNQNEQLNDPNEPGLLRWLRTNAAILLSTLVVVLGGLIGLWRWLGDRRSEREKRAEEHFQSAVTGFGNEKEYAKIGAAVTLRTFLRPGYEQFYTQTLDLAVANLRLPGTSHLSEDPDGMLQPPEDPNTPLTLTALSQTLIMVFKEAFPLAREWVKQGSPSSRFQRTKAQLKRILRREPTFDPRSLNATNIQLDRAFLWKADLEGVWLAWASLRETDLTEAKLSRAWLWRSDLTQAKLYGADLREANLGQDILHEADLRKASLNKVTLWGADLRKADLRKADLREAEVKEVKLTEISSAELKLIKPVLREADRNASYWDDLRKWANHIDYNPSEADLSGDQYLLADLTGADLTGADLTGADLRGVNGLTK